MSTLARSEQRRRDKAATRQAERSASLQCIGPIPPPADPARREAALADFQVFRREYHAAKFYLPDAADHARLDAAIVEAICSSGTDDPRAFAFPRGCGKTTRATVGAEWAVLSGRKRFPVLIGANDRKASGILETLFKDFTTNEQLVADFPEICLPLVRLENKFQRRRSQTYLDAGGERRYTNIEKAANVLMLPDVEGSPARQSAFYVFGIASQALRGTQYLDPVTGEILRPDLVILDDVQNDASSLSAAQCSKTKDLIESAIKFMRGPARPLAVFMCCTVNYEDDVADEYTDPARKPRWRGLRVSMLPRMPVNLQAWQVYFDFRDQLYQQDGLDVAEIAEKLNAYYRRNQEVLEDGAEASWPENYDESEVSAIQHAMHLYRDDEGSFWSECQNKPQTRSAATRPLDPKVLAAKTGPSRRGEVPPETAYVVTFIDIQDEILFWATLAVDSDFSGTFVDYGTWPNYDTSRITKAEAAKLRGLTRRFFQKYPDQAGPAGAPFEAKLYLALSECCDWHLSRRFPVGGAIGKQAAHSLVGFDMRWGEGTETCKRFLRDRRDNRLVGAFGQFVGATNRPLDQYRLEPGWILEARQHPHLSESRWMARTDNQGTPYLLNDANALKSFLVKRLAAPIGVAGCITLFDAPEKEHELFCSHVCLSEAAMSVSAAGRTVDQWQVLPGGRDNDFLDCAAGCMALASRAGASLKPGGSAKEQQPRRRLATAEEMKQRARARADKRRRAT